MINIMLAIKKGMTASYDSRGRRVGATVLEVGPNFVTQIKTSEGKDGYNGVQIGFSSKKSVKNPQVGHLKKAGIDQKLRWMREVRITDKAYETQTLEDLQSGKEIKVGDIFSAGDSVKVTGVSKGKGFQGGVKRYGFAGGPKTHGQSDRHRAPGSSGQTTTPGRVYKGKKMAGHMGSETVSYLGMEVLSVDKKNNLVTIKGGVPGPINGLVIIQKQGRIKGYIAPPEPEVVEEEELVQASEEQVAEAEVDQSEKQDQEVVVEEEKKEVENG